MSSSSANSNTRIHRTVLSSPGTPKIKSIAPLSATSFFAISQSNTLFFAHIIKFHEWNGKTTKNPKIPLPTPMDVQFIPIYNFSDNISDMRWSLGGNFLTLCDDNGNVTIFEKDVLVNVKDEVLIMTNSDKMEDVPPEEDTTDEPDKKRRRLHSPGKEPLQNSTHLHPYVHFTLQHESKEPGKCIISMCDSWFESSSSSGPQNTHLVAVSRDFSRDIHVYKITRDTKQPSLLRHFKCSHLVNKVLLFPLSPAAEASQKSANCTSIANNPLLAALQNDTVLVWDLSKLTQVASFKPTTSAQPLYDINYFFRQKVTQLGTVGEDRSVIVHDSKKYCAQSAWKQCMKYAPGGIFFSSQHQDLCFVYGRDSQELKVANFVSTKNVKRNTSMYAHSRWAQMDYFKDEESSAEYLFGCVETGEIYVVENPHSMAQ